MGMSPTVLYQLTKTYYYFLRKGLAIAFLLLFMGGFAAESISYHLNDYCQSELVDFEQEEKDSEKAAASQALRKYVCFIGSHTQ